MEKPLKTEKLYTIVAKVNNEHFVKYRCSDLLSFTSFLDKSYPGWRWFNVFDKKTKVQIGNFTNKIRPQKKHIL